MARADTLPIYLATYRLLLELYQTTAKFDKKYKYSLGEAVQTDAMRLLRLIYQANHRESKVADLEDFLGVYEVVKIQLRLAKDLNLISIKKMAHLSVLMTDIAKQAAAWIKHEKQRVIKKTGEEPVSPVFAFQPPPDKMYYPPALKTKQPGQKTADACLLLKAAALSGQREQQPSAPDDKGSEQTPVLKKG